MNKCSWCESTLAVRTVETVTIPAALCRDCQAINRREVANGSEVTL